MFFKFGIIFVIDNISKQNLMQNIEFKITTYEYSHNYTLKDFEKWILPNDYHSVYILENEKDAYIGETLRIKERANEHKSKRRKFNFNRMHVITSDLMEETPAKHFEKLLITLMKIDGRFNIVNGDDGITTHYIRQNLFELHFDKIWNQLAEKGLVKTKQFKFIMNLDVYKYSPYIKLNKEQTDTLTHIMNVLDSGEINPYSEEYTRRPILINGRAGTGKTVVASSLFHYLRNQDRYKDKKIALVVADSQMRDILQEVFKKTGEGLKKKDVISPIELTKRKYNIIICDEVHALRRIDNLVRYKKHFEEGNKKLRLDNTHDELDWILKQSDYQILFYDEKQCVRHSDIRDNYVKERIHNNKYMGFREIELKSQMRIKAGRSYISYIHDIFHQKVKLKKSFKNYDFKLFSSFSEMRKKISEKEDIYELSKLCGGYAWKWVSNNKPITVTDIDIEGEKIRWNDYNIKNWVRSEESKNTMGSLYTLRGIDLNYAGVVIGPDLYFDKNDNKIKVNKKSLYSNDVKKNATDEEIREYVLNTYAILFTRAIEGTYVYVCDEALRGYFKSFIDPA